MPKKKKKSKKVKDPLQEARELLRKDHICQAQHLTTEIDAENKTKAELAARLAQISQFWDFEKKHLEEKKLQLQKLKDNINEASARHSLHLDDTRGGIKNQLYQQQNELTRVKNKAQLEVHHVQREYSQAASKNACNVVEHQDVMKNMEIAHYHFMTKICSNHDEDISSLRDDFKRSFSQITEQSDRKSKNIRDEKEAIMDIKLKELGNERGIQTHRVEHKYEQIMHELSTVCNDKLHGELDRIQEQKRDLSHSRKELRSMEKRAECLEARNEDIVEPFAKAKENSNRLGKEKECFHVNKKILEKRKAELMTEESRLKDLQWHHEVLFQKFQLLSIECGNIHNDVRNKRLEQQQQMQLHEMVLGNQVTKLVELGRDQIDILSNLLKGFGSLQQHSFFPKVGGGKTRMEELKSIQTNVQHLHNLFMAEKRSIEIPKATITTKLIIE